MIGFLGEFEATLDAKGRFLLPVSFKKQLPEEDTARFVINRGFEKCLSLYPIKNWELLFNDISNIDEFDEEARQFRRIFLNGATYVEPDSAGRLLIPSNLKEYAGLDKNIVLVSAVKKLEIWDSKKYHELFDSLSAEDYSRLAKKIMGRQTNS